ncbi:MAG TPA: L,D-transpeptidase family protein [Nitrobacter sp.]|jgi:murein L,D-transpeptidase YcbB/YkuD|nr:L,D-transpeptidase family protein [Nitrobacter sp.]
MRDYSTHRTGFDRILMAVAATFLTVSASTAFAQSDTAKKSAADLAIDAAVPMPQPANVPPPTAADFKMDNVPPAPTTAAAAKPADAKPADNKAADSNPSSPGTDAKAASDDKTAADAKPADGEAAAAIKPADATSTDAKPADVATTPAGEASPAGDARKDAATTPATSTPPAATAAAPAAAKDAKTDAKTDSAAPASNVAAADQPVADKLHELLDSKSAKLFERKAERAAVEKFYTARNYAPLWTENGQLTDAAKGVIARLKDAEDDGLNPADYPVPDFAAAAASPDQLAEADLKLTASMMDYARQAQSGRMHWSQVSGDISYPEHPINPEQVLTHVTTAKDASAALDSYNPPQKLYQELKQKLAELRGKGDGPVTQIADGPALKYVAARGKKHPAEIMEDSRVPMLRTKLGITENADDTHYDAKVAAAVRKFQANAGLKPTGILDARTVKAINSPKRGREIDTIIVNMERWRWLPRDLGAPSLGDAYVILNIPDYTLKVMQHGKTVWKTRVVTGKPGIHATPLLTETMKYITVNPTWNVPPSIVYGEYLPALQQDPTVLQRMGLKLERDRNGGIHISQPPGAGNALGRIRFNFPNKFLVYQHDTPDKYLFNKEVRAYSHGCMRVQNPDQYAAVLLGITLPQDHYTPEKIRSMYGSSEIDIKFPTPIPVNITYQTAFVNDAGKLEFRRDVYGRDAQMLALLRNPKGRDLEAVVAHAQPSYARPKADIPQGVAFNDDERGGFGGGPFSGPFGSSGPNFFERLFGGAPPPPPPPVDDRRRRIYRH